MKLLNSYQTKTLDGETIYCGDMSDGTTWYTVKGSSVIKSTDDVIENGGFELASVYSCKVTELPTAPITLDQFVGHVKAFIEF